MSLVQIPFNTRPVGFQVCRKGQNPDSDALEAQPTALIDILYDQQERDARATEACLQLVSDLQAALGQIRETMEARLDDMTDYVLTLAFGLAERVLDREIAAGRYDLRPTLTELLTQGLHGLGEGAIRIFLHPIDHERLLRGFSGHPAASLGRDVEMEVDPSVALCSFRLETRLGQVLHSPELLLERMTQKIQEELA